MGWFCGTPRGREAPPLSARSKGMDWFCGTPRGSDAPLLSARSKGYGRQRVRSRVICRGYVVSTTVQLFARTDFGFGVGSCVICRSLSLNRGCGRTRQVVCQKCWVGFVKNRRKSRRKDHIQIAQAQRRVLSVGAPVSARDTRREQQNFSIERAASAPPGSMSISDCITSISTIQASSQTRETTGGGPWCDSNPEGVALISSIQIADKTTEITDGGPGNDCNPGGMKTSSLDCNTMVMEKGVAADMILRPTDLENLGPTTRQEALSDRIVDIDSLTFDPELFSIANDEEKPRNGISQDDSSKPKVGSPKRELTADKQPDPEPCITFLKKEADQAFPARVKPNQTMSALAALDLLGDEREVTQYFDAEETNSEEETAEVGTILRERAMGDDHPCSPRKERIRLLEERLERRINQTLDSLVVGSRASRGSRDSLESSMEDKREHLQQDVQKTHKAKFNQGGSLRGAVPQVVPSINFSSLAQMESEIQNTGVDADNHSKYLRRGVPQVVPRLSISQIPPRSQRDENAFALPVEVSLTMCDKEAYAAVHAGLKINETERSKQKRLFEKNVHDFVRATSTVEHL